MREQNWDGLKMIETMSKHLSLMSRCHGVSSETHHVSLRAIQGHLGPKSLVREDKNGSRMKEFLWRLLTTLDDTPKPQGIM